MTYLLEEDEFLECSIASAHEEKKCVQHNGAFVQLVHK